MGRASKKAYRVVAADLINGNKIVLVLNQDEICTEGKRTIDGKHMWGVPHRSENDCRRFCVIGKCDGL